MDAHPGLLAQGIQQRFVNRMAGHQGGGHGHLQIMLGHKSLQHLQRLRVVHMGGKVRPVAQVAPTAHHGQIHTGFAAADAHRQHIDIAVVHRVHRLLVQHFGQSTQLVAQIGRLLKFQFVGMGQHAPLQVLHHLLGFAAQQALGAVDIARVLGQRGVAHARPRTAPNLVQQTRARAVVEHRVLAGAQAKHLLDQLHGLAHRPHTGVGAKIIVPFVHCTPVIHHARDLVRFGRATVGGLAVGVAGVGDLHIGVALVVAKQNVVARLEAFDEVVLQQQGLGLRAHHGGLHARDLAHHVANAGATVFALKVAVNAPFQMVGFAHIQHLIVSIEIAVHPRQRRQGRDLGHQFWWKCIRRFGAHAPHCAVGAQGINSHARFGPHPTSHACQHAAQRHGASPAPDAVGCVLPRHRQPRRPRCVLALGGSLGGARASGAAVGGSGPGFAMDGPPRASRGSCSDMAARDHLPLAHPAWPQHGIHGPTRKCRPGARLISARSGACVVSASPWGDRSIWL